MALIPIFEVQNIVTYKSVDKEKIKIIMICAHAQCKQKQHKIQVQLPMRGIKRKTPCAKKCLKAIVQEGHNICTSEWEMLSAILKANTV